MASLIINAGNVPAAANPSGLIGLSAINGAAATWTRSDATHALDVSIAPTWTALHTFSAGVTISGGSFTLSGHTLSLSANATVGGTNTGDQTIPVGANPSAKVGPSATNGAAATFMRSDAAPAIDETIAYVWTGSHTFTASAGFTINGVSAGQATDAKVQRTSTTANTVEEGANIELWDTGATTVSSLQQAGGQTELWQYNAGWNQIFKILTTRGMVINAPASGQALAMTGVAAGTAVLSINTATQTGAGTISILLTDFPGTNTGAKTPKYIPVMLDGAKHWIQAIPD